MENIIDFVVLVSMQLVVFCAFYYYNRTYFDTKFLPLITKSCLVGIPFGMLFDFMIGHHAGVFSYTLGFDTIFLFFNGLLSYGFMIASVWTMSRLPFFGFYLQTIIIGSVYELTNLYFPVWQWTFSSSSWLEYFVVVGAAYMGLSALMALSLRLTVRVKFSFCKKGLELS